MTLSNNGPKDAPQYQPDVDALQERLEGLSDVTVDENIAEQLNDLMSEARSTASAIEKDRKAIKQPSIDEGKAVDKRFKAVSSVANNVVTEAKGLLAPYLREQARIAAEAERVAREEAQRKAREAELLARDASFGQLAAQEASEAKGNLIQASAFAESAKRVGSSSGMARAASLRSYWDATIVDAKEAAIYFCDHPKVIDLLAQLAEAAMRADKTKSLEIAGVSFNERKEVA